MQSVRRPVIVLALLFAVACALPAFAQQPLIHSTRMTDGNLVIQGANFGTKPTVVLAGTALSGVSVNSDGTQITAPVPALDAGSYTLVVSVSKRQVSSVVTIAAAGVPGPAGPAGPPGPPGVPGPGALMVVDANEVVLGGYLNFDAGEYFTVATDGFAVLFKLVNGDFQESDGGTVIFWHTAYNCDGTRYIATSTSNMWRRALIRGRAAVWATTQTAPIVPHSNTQCPVGADLITGTGCHCDTGSQPESISSVHLASPVLDLSAAVPPFRIK